MVTGKRPLLVGTVTLDFLHTGAIGRARPPVTLRWGGVVNNVACAMAARGVRPVFVTADYTGELRPAVAAHLERNGVEWAPLPVRVPLPVFEAELVDGSVADKLFVGQEALDLLSPALLATRPDLMDRASVVVAGTDGHPATLSWLCTAARRRGVPFWLLSADPAEVGKLVPGEQPASFVALNLRELSLWAGEELTDERKIALTARQLVADGGHCLVTLGEEGSLLVAADGTEIVRQPAVDVGSPHATVGAGDVLFGCLLTARLAGLDWPAALAEATVLTSAFLTADRYDTTPYAALRPVAAAAAARGGPPPGLRNGSPAPGIC